MTQKAASAADHVRHVGSRWVIVIPFPPAARAPRRAASRQQKGGTGTQEREGGGHRPVARARRPAPRASCSSPRR